MPDPAPSPFALRVCDLPASGTRSFEISPERAQLDALTHALDLDALRKLRFVGTLHGHGAQDWELNATLGATVVQPCAVTLAPVTTRIETVVRRVFQKNPAMPDAPEMEMPEDDTIEPLGSWIDLYEVMTEALSLALPEYPRADGATLGETVLTEPGKAALTDADLKPFAALASLKDQLNSE